MNLKILDQLADCKFIVEVDNHGAVSAGLYAAKRHVGDALIHAVSNELESALESALQGDYVGGYEFDKETGTLQQRELDI